MEVPSAQCYPTLVMEVTPTCRMARSFILDRSGLGLAHDDFLGYGNKTVVEPDMSHNASGAPTINIRNLLLDSRR